VYKQRTTATVSVSFCLRLQHALWYDANISGVSGGMSKITNGGLSPYYIFAVVLLSVVGEHHIMPSFQDEYDTQQNVNAGKQRRNFARFRVEFCCVYRMQ